MPIEIKELIIRATIEEQAKGDKKQPPSEEKAVLIEACVEQVLDILRKERER